MSVGLKEVEIEWIFSYTKSKNCNGLILYRTYSKYELDANKTTAFHHIE